MKKLNLVLLVSMTMGLTACGGGSGSGSSTDSSAASSSSTTNGSTTTTDTTAGTTVTASALSSFDTIDFRPSDTKENTFVDISSHITSDGKSYYATQNLINQASLAASYFDDVKNSDMLTDTNFYQADPTLYANGYKLQNIVSMTDNSVVTTPATLTNANDLQITQTVKWIDLSGLPVTSHTAVQYAEDLADPLTAASYTTTVMPGFNQNPIQVANNALLINFINAAKATTYPAGSKCFIITNWDANKPYFDLYADLHDGMTISQYVSSYTTGAVTQGNWAGHDWVYQSITNPNGSQYLSAGVQETGGVMTGEYLQHDSIDRQASFFAVDQAKVTPQIYDSWQHKIDSLQNECTGYNATAFDTIKTLVNNTH